MTAEETRHIHSSARKRLRVTTGCKTCRKRHVKCDEAKPTCFNCGKKDRLCEYDRLPDRTESGSGESPVAVAPAPQSVYEDERIPTDHFDIHGSAHTVSTVDNPVAPQEEVFQTAEGPGETPLSACSPWSPFSATLETILLQAGAGSRTEDQPSHDSTVLCSLDTGYSRQINAPTHNEIHPGTHAQLTDIEIVIFRNYVENVSKWVDSFSHDQPFHRLVPVLALQNPFLLHACLALSSKQMALTGLGVHESTAVRYYRLALRTVSTLLMDPQYAYSDEVLAACIILSTYEMIDVVGESLGSHLRGVASLLQSRQISGDLFGIKGSCYWTWYRHEIWASLQTSRRMSLDERFWKPSALDTFDGLTIENIANRVIFIFGQCINFCNDDRLGSLSGDQLMDARVAKAEELAQALEEWKSKLPMSMSSFTVGTSDADSSSAFPSMWFMFPQSAIAHQVYHASKIILALHRPPTATSARGLGNLTSLSLRRQIEASREQVLLTANAGIPDAWSLVSAQCLYIAGLVTDGILERNRTLELIDLCQQRSGRKTSFITDELRRLWHFHTPSET